MMRFLWSPIDPLITAAYLLSKCLQGKLVPGTYLKSAFKEEFKIFGRSTIHGGDTHQTHTLKPGPGAVGSALMGPGSNGDWAMPVALILFTPGSHLLFSMMFVSNMTSASA